jgi:hypothetical protein
MQSRDADLWAANELGFLITLGDKVFFRINGGTIAGLI